MSFMNKKFALTFAELALVMAIIGITAAITIPQLKKHSQRTELGVQLQKAYLNLEDVADNAIMTEGPMRNWDFSSNKVFFEKYFVPNLRTIKVENNGSCGDEECYVITMDGAKMSVANCGSNKCQVYVDVNGDNLPNLAGKDQFRFQFTKSGDDDYYLPETVRPLENGVEHELAMHGWRFSTNLWNCEPGSAASYNGSCKY